MGKQNRRRSKIVMSKGKQDKGSSEAKEPVKVYKWDGTAVKNALDDAVKEVMTAKLPYTENFNPMDGRLVICAVAVGVAMFALLWDFLNPFPNSRPVLIGCVASYFLLMGVLTLYTTFKEKGRQMPRGRLQSRSRLETSLMRMD